MSDVTASVEAVEEVRPVELSADVLDEQLIGQLVDRARARGLQLTGEGGLLQQLTKRLLESASVPAVGTPATGCVPRPC
ncbi:transposase [Actinacidiphila sp. bgisy160]|uniref:transposase n=1 Tax=Actinacidiphila sp. bgisy160 TaxID=3413796 RepID=UPI003D758591